MSLLFQQWPLLLGCLSYSSLCTFMMRPAPLDDIMSYLTSTSIQWGIDPRITSHELIEIYYLFFRISCHSIWPISHLHTIPIERYAFLYALVTNAPRSFPTLSFDRWLRFIGVVLLHMVFSSLFLFIGFCYIQDQMSFLHLSSYTLQLPQVSSSFNGELLK